MEMHINLHKIYFIIKFCVLGDIAGDTSDDFLC